MNPLGTAPLCARPDTSCDAEDPFIWLDADGHYHALMHSLANPGSSIAGGKGACACVRVCVRACARVRACVRVCMCACVHACMCACVHTYDGWVDAIG